VTADLLAAGVLGRTGAGPFTVAVGGHRPVTVPVTLTVEARTGAAGQRWTRTVRGRRVTTTLAWRDGGLLEWLGPVEMAFAAEATAAGAVLRLGSAAVVAGRARARLPRFLTPSITCTTTTGAGGGLAVRVEVRSRRGRPLLAYGGTIT
jgi:hypothetical protein